MGDNVRLRHFGDCARLVRDTCNPTDVPPLTPYIGLEHIPENDLHLSDYGFAGDVASTKTKFKKEDILFGKLRPYFRKVIIAPFDGVCSTDIWVVRAKKEVDQKYLFYWMASHEFVDQATQGSEGTKMPRAKWEYISRFEQPVPSLPEQHFIAEVLGALDDKIELNRRMNATLESMARAVFKAWFMENEEAKGWKIGQIKDLGDVVCGKTPPTNDKENYDGDIPFITIPDMHNKVFITQTRKTLSEKGAQTQSKKTLPVFAICVSCIATPGLVSLTTKPSQTNQQINNLVPNDKKSVFYCYYALRALADEIRARGSGGSVVVNLNKGQFEILPVVIPPATKLHEFQEQVEPLFLRLLANENESRTLAALRDALLPRLMSGEVRVKADKTNSPIEKG